VRNLLIILASLIILVDLSACKKYNNDSLESTWQWKRSTGGIAGITEYPTAGKAVTLQFYKDLTYAVSINGKVSSTGKYRLSTNGNFPVIYFDNIVTADRLFISAKAIISKMENGEMVLYDDGYSDGFAHYFIK
jgi:hypothetical protein